jgi:hypothetical protein
MYLRYELSILKGQSHDIFNTRFISANNTPGSPDLCANAISNINSYSRRYTIIKFDSALYRTARSRHIFVNISAKLKPNLKIFLDDNLKLGRVS